MVCTIRRQIDFADIAPCAQQEYDTHAALLLAQRSPLAPLELFGLKSNSERASASRQSSDGR